MFNQPVEQRLSIWYNLRQELITDSDPLNTVWKFWKDAPFIPYNHKIDRYNYADWPTPWEIIVQNKYDDFTKALMIGWTLKFCTKFKNSDIELKSLVDNTKNTYYNVIYIDKNWIINYLDSGPIQLDKLPESIFIDYSIKLGELR